MNREQIIDKLNSDTLKNLKTNRYDIYVKKNNIIRVASGRKITKWKIEIKDEEISFVKQITFSEWILIATFAFIDLVCLYLLINHDLTIRTIVFITVIMVVLIGVEYLLIYLGDILGLYRIKVFLKEYFDKDLK
jgi:hypothetical protein